MRKNIILCTCILINLCASFSVAQNSESADADSWNVSAEGDFNFTDPFFILPIVTADKNKLHLEARYNYEELKTFSGWIGYNFSGGKEFQSKITPMGGFLLGRITGFAPGLEIQLEYSGFEFYSESEFVFDTEDKENNFYYNWTDLTYSPADWLFFGFSAQRTKAYETDLDIQRGFLIGGSLANLELSGYCFNPGTDDLYFLIAASIEL